MTESSDNGVVKKSSSKSERQHCPACNTDGEHVFSEIPVGADRLYRCINCGDTHTRHAVVRVESTVAANAAILSQRAVSERAVVPNDAVTLVRESVKQARLAQPLDKINKPAHYNYSDLEPIDVIEKWNLPFHLGSALKYLARAGRKPGEETVDDLDKLIWYVKRYRDEVVRPQLQVEQESRPQ